MMGETESDINFFLRIFLFYFTYVLILNTFAFVSGVPSFFDMNPNGADSYSELIKVIGSLTLGNFDGIPPVLNLFIFSLGTIFISIPVIMFTYNKIRGI